MERNDKLIKQLRTKISYSVRQMKKRIKKKKSFSSKFKIEGEIQNKKNMVFILAGYKPYLWDDVFTRIKQFQPPDLEVCVASSGLYNNELSLICKKNGWV